MAPWGTTGRVTVRQRAYQRSEDELDDPRSLRVAGLGVDRRLISISDDPMARLLPALRGPGHHRGPARRHALGRGGHGTGLWLLAAARSASHRAHLDG